MVILGSCWFLCVGLFFVVVVVIIDFAECLFKVIVVVLSVFMVVG